LWREEKGVYQFFGEVEMPHSYKELITHTVKARMVSESSGDENMAAPPS